MADATMTVQVGVDLSALIGGLRDAAAALERAQTLMPGGVTLDDALEAVIDLVTQHCRATEDGDTYDTMALSANRDAFDLLVRAGRAVYVEEPYGRMAAIRFHPPVAAPDA